MATRSRQTTEWFQSQRGISEATLDAFGIGGTYPAAEYPYENSTKVRPDLFDRRRFWQPPIGVGDIQLFGPDQPGRAAYFLVEGESDTMALWQALGEAGKLDTAGVYGLSGVNTWRSEFGGHFDTGHTVYVVLDNDDPYENPIASNSVEGAWAKIKADLGRRAVRVRLPKGIKDVAEFFQTYDYAAFQALVKSTPRQQWHFQAVDFNQPVPDRDWMLEGVLHRAALNLFVGDPGSGKSFLTMGLAVALLEDWPTFMNRPVQHHGRVYYVDEENPLDVVLQRMHMLGLTEKGKDPDRLRYLHNQGLDVDDKWELIRDEILQFEPTYVVFDSLSEITHGDENSKDDIATALKNIKSISRDMGATVALIHHTDKTRGTARGSGHIRAVTDSEWWVGTSDIDDTLLRMVCKKHRYGVQRGTTIPFRIEDEFGPDGQSITLHPARGDGEEPF